MYTYAERPAHQAGRLRTTGLLIGHRCPPNEDPANDKVAEDLAVRRRATGAAPAFRESRSESTRVRGLLPPRPACFATNSRQFTIDVIRVLRVPSYPVSSNRNSRSPRRSRTG